MTAKTTATWLTKMNAVAIDDPSRAREEVWSWLRRLGAGLPDAAAHADLVDLFAAGDPADVDGQTEGMFVGWTAAEGLDRAGSVTVPIAKAAVAGFGVPWLGKKFDRSEGRGTNSLPRTAYLLTRVLAPGYRMRKVGDHWEGFEMLNRVEDSVLFPGVPVLVLDYETIGTNPWPINRIRDEAVQIVPGVYVGAKIWHQSDGYRQLAWWASRSPVGSRDV